MTANHVALSPNRGRRVRVDWGALASGLLLPMLAVVLALAIGAVLLWLLHADPFKAYAALIGGAFGTTSGVTQSVVKATPLLLVALGIIIAFRANVINIGAEGQIILGALAGTWFALTFATWPGLLLIPATLLMGFLAGAAWGFVAGS